MDKQDASQNKEEFVLPLMMVPDELAFELGEFHVLTVELANDPKL